MTMFKEVDAACVAMCLDDGWACCNMYDEILQMDEETLETYRALPPIGVRDSFIGMFSGTEKFGYYEAFTFQDGHRGLIEKGYNCGQVLETFILSLYNDEGYGYILDRDGDILPRSVSMTSGRVYDNVFTALSDTHSPQDDIDAFRAAMDAEETGSIVFQGDRGEYVYTYAPVESVDGWYLLSIVPVNAIRAERDQMLRDTQMTLFLFAAALVLCAVFILLMWRTQKEIEDKDQAVDYQSQVIDIFSAYLSRNTNNVFLLLDAEDARIEYVSDNLKRVFGISEAQLLSGLRDMDARSTSGEDISLEALRGMEPGAQLEAVSAEWIHPNTQEHKWFQGNLYCVQIQGKNKVMIYISDLTRERKVQHDLSEALTMAQAANAAKSAFLSSVSHDIRTPMNAITGFLALMQDEADKPAAVREYAQRIDAASQHLLGLINDVLDMNKIESGSTTLNISEMDLADVIDEINTIIRPQSKAKKQTFEIFASRPTYEHLLGDKMRIDQILINLLSNAVKYTPEGGTIEMRVEELSQVVSDYSRVRFTISDNGIGMSEEYLKVIFELFTREETRITHKIQGTGLGMAITKSLVDLMGGSIRVESELGKGSTFTVELELRIQKREDREDDPGFWDEHSVTRMITVDDDEEVCRNIVKAMAKTGVATDYATDGETAIEMMREAREGGRPYDLILLDWKMPVMDGYEATRAIRASGHPMARTVPIIAMTANAFVDDVRDALEAGMDAHIAKPVQIETLKNTIQQVLDSRSEQAEGAGASAKT